MLREFREFINRGNIVELAVGCIMGLGSAEVVTTFTDRIISPLIAFILPGLDELAAVSDKVVLLTEMRDSLRT